MSYLGLTSRPPKVRTTRRDMPSIFGLGADAGDWNHEGTKGREAREARSREEGPCGKLLRAFALVIFVKLRDFVVQASTRQSDVIAQGCSTPNLPLLSAPREHERDTLPTASVSSTGRG